MKVSVCNAMIAILLYLNAIPSFAGTWFVAANGTSANSGSFVSPWSLAYALSRPATVVLPGDTILVRGGVYIGPFTSSLTGTATAPVLIKNYPNENAVLLGNAIAIADQVILTVNGQYSHFMGLEITTNATTRISLGSVDPPADIYTATGVYVYGQFTKLINCIIHDCQRGGIGYWSPSLGAEVYGCVIYNNGYANSVRGHGPGLYVQNSDEAKPKKLINSFIFNGFSIGVQFYATAAGYLNGFIIDSTTVFNSGANTIPSQARRMNLLAGGANGSANPRVRGFTVTNSIFYRDTTDNTQANYIPYSSIRKNVELGTDDESLWDVNVNFNNNTIYGDPTPLLLHRWDSGSFKNNVLYAYRSNNTVTNYLIEQPFGAAPFANWDANTYYTNQQGVSTAFANKSFAEWQNAYHVDSTATYTNANPISNNYFIRNNRFEPHKYYVTVQNYTGLDTVRLPITDDRFADEFYAVYDIQGSLKIPVDTGTFNGESIPLNMNLKKVAQLVGTSPVIPKHSSKTLGTFIIEFYPECNTVKPGSWNDATVWASGKVPEYYNRVKVSHNVSVTANGWCKSVTVKNAQVTVAPGVLLNIGRQWF